MRPGPPPPARVLHRLELPFLVLSEQRFEPRVELLLNLFQSFLLAGGEFQRVLLRWGEDLAGRGGSPGPGPPGGGTNGAKTVLI